MPSILVISRERGRGGDREGRDRERQGNTGSEMGRLKQGEREILGWSERERQRNGGRQRVYMSSTPVFCGKSQGILHSWDTIRDLSVSKFEVFLYQIFQ